jgi:hypothetical protein
VVQSGSIWFNWLQTVWSGKLKENQWNQTGTGPNRTLATLHDDDIKKVAMLPEVPEEDADSEGEIDMPDGWDAISVLYSAPPIPAGIRRNGTGICKNSQEWDRNPLDSCGIRLE